MNAGLLSGIFLVMKKDYFCKSLGFSYIYLGIGTQKGQKMFLEFCFVFSVKHKIIREVGIVRQGEGIRSIMYKLT